LGQTRILAITSRQVIEDTFTLPRCLRSSQSKARYRAPGMPFSTDPRTRQLGTLTRFLQDAFAAKCPKGWQCDAEVPLVDRDAARRLGFEPRADVVLAQRDGSRRIWVEFEISRADPVANHAKFATAALLEGLAPGDCFVSMTSRHIVAGRAALAAGTTIWMRSLGIPAFQVDLLPQFSEPQIKALNARPLTVADDLAEVPVRAEIDRILDVSSAAALASGHRIHRADNPFTVALNVRRWNAEVQTEPGRTLWGRRRVQFFAMCGASRLFAPSKFCAFIPAPAFGSRVVEPGGALGMSLEVYAQLGEQDPRFDGNVARTHLERRLGYRALSLADTPPSIRDAFGRWLPGVEAALKPHPEPWVLISGR